MKIYGKHISGPVYWLLFGLLSIVKHETFGQLKLCLYKRGPQVSRKYFAFANLLNKKIKNFFKPHHSPTNEIIQHMKIYNSL